MGNIFGRHGVLDDITRGARDVRKTSDAIFTAKRSVQRTAIDVTTTPYQWHTGINRAHTTANRSEAGVHNSQAAIYRSETNEQRAMDQRDAYMNNRNANQGYFGANTRPTVGGIPANNNVPQVLDVSKKDQARYDELMQLEAQLKAADVNHNGQIDTNEMTPDVKQKVKEADKLARKIGNDDIEKMNAYYAREAEGAQSSKVQQNTEAERPATVDFLNAVKLANTTTGADHDAAIVKAKEALQKLPHDEFGNVQLNPDLVDPRLKEAVLKTGKAGNVPEIFKLTSDEALLNAAQKAYQDAGVGKAPAAATPAATEKTGATKPAASEHPVKDFSDAMREANLATTDDARKGALGRAAIALQQLDADKSKFKLDELDPAIKAKLMEDPAAAMTSSPNALIRKASDALAGAKVGTAVAQNDVDAVVTAVRAGKPLTGKAPDAGVEGNGHKNEPVIPAAEASGPTYDKSKYGSRGTQEVANAQIELELLGFSTDKDGIKDGKVDGVKGRFTTDAIAKAEAVLKEKGLLPEGHVAGAADAAFTKALQEAQKKPEVLAALQAASGNKPEAVAVAKTETPAVVKTEATGLAKLTPEQTKALQADLVAAGLLTQDQANGKWDETQVNALRAKIEKLNDVGKYAAHDSRGYVHINVEEFLKDPTQRVEQTTSHIGAGTHYSQPMIDTLLGNNANKVAVVHDLSKELNTVVLNEKKVPDYVVINGVEQPRPDLPSDAIWTDSKGNQHGGLDGHGGQSHPKTQHPEVLATKSLSDGPASDNLLTALAGNLVVGDSFVNKFDEGDKAKTSRLFERAASTNIDNYVENGTLEKSEIVEVLNKKANGFTLKAGADEAKFDALLKAEGIERTAKGYVVADTTEASAQVTQKNKPLEVETGRA